MKLTSQSRNAAGPGPAAETIMLSKHHASFLARMSQEINPAMPKAFGWPDAIRRILERFEDSDIDLTAASSEYEIARLAAGELRARNRRRPATNAS